MSQSQCCPPDMGWLEHSRSKLQLPLVLGWIQQASPSPVSPECALVVSQTSLVPSWLTHSVPWLHAWPSHKTHHKLHPVYTNSPIERKTHHLGQVLDLKTIIFIITCWEFLNTEDLHQPEKNCSRMHLTTLSVRTLVDKVGVEKAPRLETCIYSKASIHLAEDNGWIHGTNKVIHIPHSITRYCTCLLQYITHHYHHRLLCISL